MHVQYSNTRKGGEGQRTHLLLVPVCRKNIYGVYENWTNDQAYQMRRIEGGGRGGGARRKRDSTWRQDHSHRVPNTYTKRTEFEVGLLKGGRRCKIMIAVRPIRAPGQKRSHTVMSLKSPRVGRSTARSATSSRTPPSPSPSPRPPQPAVTSVSSSNRYRCSASSKNNDTPAREGIAHVQ